MSSVVNMDNDNLMIVLSAVQEHMYIEQNVLHIATCQPLLVV
jgi:hypothetical protein